ncbi:MAG: class I SAM-dependent methyltransferase, partial [Chlorobium limicola]|nr:class I SAM-dependent methyltransferase [Chlorobium limicola]
MAGSTRSAIIDAGIRSADAVMTDEDRIWSKYSNDKIDIGERLAKVIRTLSVA